MDDPGHAQTLRDTRVRAPADQPGRPAPGMSRTQRVLNVVTRGLLRSPLHRVVSARILVITVTGRRTGTIYRLPVGYVECGGTWLVGTAGTWRRNLRSGEPVSVLVRGRRRVVTVEVITDEERCAQLYRVILARNPTHGRYAQIRTEPDGAPNRGDLGLALERGLAVVRLTPR